MKTTSGPEPSPPLRRAAEYVRMSTEHQKYSTENQSDAILAYAASQGMEIVQTYADAGKSGLRIEGRELSTKVFAGQCRLIEMGYRNTR